MLLSKNNFYHLYNISSIILPSNQIEHGINLDKVYVKSNFGQSLKQNKIHGYFSISSCIIKTYTACLKYILGL
jgi:hypothetical protein